MKPFKFVGTPVDVSDKEDPCFLPQHTSKHKHMNSHLELDDDNTDYNVSKEKSKCLHQKSNYSHVRVESPRLLEQCKRTGFFFC